jgi:hypothetical protein
VAIEEDKLRAGILGVRDALLAEHLGVTRENLAATLSVVSGSLSEAIDRLVRSTGPTLVSFEPPELSEVEQSIASTHVLDPHRPEAMAKTFVRALRQLLPFKGAFLGAIALAGVSLVIWQKGHKNKRRRSRR